MRVSFAPDCLAIDGGGTRCRFALVQGTDIHRAEGGEANVSSDFDGSVATILNGVAELACLSGRDKAHIADLPAFIGLAGVTGPALIDRLKIALPFRNALYVDDRPAAVRAALGDRDGVLAHCGTGSFFAAQVNGNARFAGGWGPVLGDEGSAQLIGRRLLWVTLQTEDGFRPRTPLIDAVFQKIGSAPEIVAFAGTAKPHELGALAPLISRAAEEDDPSALALLQEAADLVAVCIRQIGWTPGMAICLTGGIAGRYAPYLPGDMQTEIVTPQADPIDGAIDLAREFARKACT